MYYKSERNKLKKWLGNTNLKPYVIILLFILIITGLIFFIGRDAFSDFLLPEETLEGSSGSAGDSTSEDNIETQNTEPSNEEAETESLSVLGRKVIVNKSDNIVSIWNTVDGELGSLEKVFLASVNVNLENGTYFISEKNTWRTLEDYTCVQYSSKSATDILFHSPSYEFQNRGYMIVETYSMIGSINDLLPGITLTVADAKWIYENCSEETEIVVCEDSELSAKYDRQPDEIREIPDGIRWDPTDPDKGNKWVSTQIKFLQGVTDKTVQVGTGVDPWNGVYAESVDGKNITNNLTIRNNVDSNVPGTYVIEYILADFTGQVVRQFAYVTVVGDSQAEDVSISDSPVDDSPVENVPPENETPAI